MAKIKIQLNKADALEGNHDYVVSQYLKSMQDREKKKVEVLKGDDWVQINTNEDAKIN